MQHLFNEYNGGEEQAPKSTIIYIVPWNNRQGRNRIDYQKKKKEVKNGICKKGLSNHKGKHSNHDGNSFCRRDPVIKFTENTLSDPEFKV